MYIRVTSHFILVLIATLIVTIAVSYNRMTRDAQVTAEAYLINELNGLYTKYDYASDAVKTLTELNNQSMLARARSVAKILELSPDITEKDEALQALCNDIDAEGILICTPDGMVTAAAPSKYAGSMLKHECRDLLECAEGKTYEKTLLATALDKTGNQARYASVRRDNAPGVIILSFYLEHERSARKLSDVADLVDNASIGDKGFLIAFDKGEPYTATADLPTTEAELRALPLGTLLEEEYGGEDYFVYAMKQDGLRLIAMQPTSEYYHTRNKSLELSIYTGLALLLALMFSTRMLMGRYIIKPLAELESTMRRIGHGNYDERLHLTTTPEFQKLAQTINIVLDTISSANDRATEKNQHELALARSIKEAVLPNVAQVFEGRSDFNISINVMQADTVGGDFYDCMMLDDTHLLFILGSIAEQGVPAALYMMRGLAIIRNYIGATTDPADLASKINYHICMGDSANIRVSILIGVLDTGTGELTCVNAGQHTPFLQKEGEAYRELPIPVSPALGKRSDAVYRQYTVHMEPGDRFFACTSALTRLPNEQRELFGEQRLHQALKEAAPTLKDVPHLVRTAVRRFIRKAERNMDYSILCLELPGVRRSGGSIDITAGDTAPVMEMMQTALEEVFAAPYYITALLEATAAVISAIPAGAQVHVVLGCTENHAKVTLTYSGEEKDILQDISGLQVHSASYHHACKINDITLHKTLG